MSQPQEHISNDAATISHCQLSIVDSAFFYRHAVTITPPWSCRRKAKIRRPKQLHTGISICSTSRSPHMKDVSVPVYKSHCRKAPVAFIFSVPWLPEQISSTYNHHSHCCTAGNLGQILNTVTVTEEGGGFWEQQAHKQHTFWQK